MALSQKQREDLGYWYSCLQCNKEYEADKPYYTCPQCQGLLMVQRNMGILKSRFYNREEFQGYFDGVKKNQSAKYPFGSGVWQWLYLMLPGFNPKYAVSLHEGHTDMWEPPSWFAKQLGLNRMLIKLEGQSPSGSFKDRGMPVAISETLRLQAEFPELQIKGVSCASTGDTSAAAAKYTAYARDRIVCVVLVPNKKISPAQMYQAMDAGAIVLALDDPGGFDTCMKVVQEFSQARPDLVLVNSKNAMRIVGQETISYEIFQDLNWQVPDWLVIPCGNGGNLSAQLNAWLMLKELGQIDRLPGIIVAQTKTANTLVRWYYSGLYSPDKPGETLASAMNIQDPVSFPRIKKHLGAKNQTFQHAFLDVSEKIIAETRAMFNSAGAGLCPQGAVAAAAALEARARGLIKEDDLVVSLSTANDLKFVDPSYHMNGLGKCSNPYRVLPANLETVKQAVAEEIDSKGADFILQCISNMGELRRQASL